jgi:hypothetical protein
LKAFIYLFKFDLDFSHMTKFLNRLLGLEVELQNALFKYFSDTMEAVIKQAKRTGRFDSGIIGMIYISIQYLFTNLYKVMII